MVTASPWRLAASGPRVARDVLARPHRTGPFTLVTGCRSAGHGLFPAGPATARTLSVDRRPMGDASGYHRRWIGHCDFDHVDDYSHRYMATPQRFRTVHCAYCGETTTVPSTRGPVATYCSPSHRQAAYRERQRAQRAGAPPPPRSVSEEIVRLRTVLARAAEARSWSEARQVLVGVDDDRGAEER